MSARQEFIARAAQRILVFDGGYGTAIQAYKLSEADYRGSLDLTHDQKGNNDLLSITPPGYRDHHPQRLSGRRCLT